MGSGGCACKRGEQRKDEKKRGTDELHDYAEVSH